MTETKTKPAVKKAAASEAKPAVKKAAVSETKPVVKKAAASETTAKKTAPKAPAKKTENVVSNNQQRYEMIQNAAYYIAEHNGFVGDPHAFWAEAEAQINNTKS